MKIHIPVPCCHNCKHYQEDSKGTGINCKSPKAPESNRKTEGYMLNCHGIGYEPTNWNGLTMEIEVTDDVINQLNENWNYHTVNFPPSQTFHEED